MQICDFIGEYMSIFGTWPMAFTKKNFLRSQTERTHAKFDAKVAEIAIAIAIGIEYFALVFRFQNDKK